MIMRNEMVKKDFIEYYIGTIKEGNNALVITAARHRLESLFNKMESFENFYNKDCSVFTKEEIMNAFAGIGTFSISTLRGYKSLLTTYTDWAITTGIAVTGINGYTLLNSTEDLVKCVGDDLNEYRLLTEEKLQEMLNNILNPSDQYLVLALYEGIRGEDYKELLNLHEEDIDIKNHKFYLRDTDRTVDVPAQLVHYALEAINTYDYTACKTVGGRMVNANLDPSDVTPIKGRVSSSKTTTQTKVKRVARRIAKLKTFFDDAPEISVPRIYMAGFVNHVKEVMEKSNIEYEEVWQSEEIKPILQQYNVEDNAIVNRNKYREYFI